MSTRMIDRVATALAAERSLDDLSAEDRATFRAAARVAIQAMLRPTKRMLAVGIATKGPLSKKWSAMVHAALGERK